VWRSGKDEFGTVGAVRLVFSEGGRMVVSDVGGLGLNEAWTTWAWGQTHKEHTPYPERRPKK
jgi:hypothetical protein